MKTNLQTIKEKGKTAINDYFKELASADLNDNQELVLIEVLIRAIESDQKVEPNEVKFIQMVKSKLKTKCYLKSVHLRFNKYKSYFFFKTHIDTYTIQRN